MSIYDVDGLLVDNSGTSITTTTSSTGVNIKLPKSTISRVSLVCNEVDRTTADETYTVAIEVSTTQGGSYTEVGRITGITATGRYDVLLDGDTVEKLLTGASWVRTTATLGGTTPILGFIAFVTKE